MGWHHFLLATYYITITSYYSVVVESLVALVHAPEPEHPLRGELAELYTKDHKTFLKNAEEFTKEHAEKRP